MAKERHTKTFQEKYGIRSVLVDLEEAMREHGNDRGQEVFDSLPQMGIFYIDEVKYRDLIYEKEDSDVIKEIDGETVYLTKAKVIAVTETFVTYIHYDDHHHSIIFCKEETEKWILKGNEICLL